jgi:dynein heavy chain, axonemal
LEDIQKSLEDYLETKRAAFPRFYFLSNDELLEILSQTRNVQAVQPHLRKCFDNILKIEFAPGKNSKDITGMWSAELEFVGFSSIVKAESNVEFWLSHIEGMMIKSLYDTTVKALQEYPSNGIERDEWLFNYPAQPVITVDQVEWTKGVTSAIQEIMRGKNRKALEEFLNFSNLQINKMVALVRGDLNIQQRTLMGALIVIDVHALEVVRNMIKARVETINDFEWQK